MTSLVYQLYDIKKWYLTDFICRFLSADKLTGIGSSLRSGTAFSLHVSLTHSSLKHFYIFPLPFITTLTFVKNIPSPI